MFTLDDALMRHFIGLDHFNRLAQASQENYPPFNIEHLDDDKYRLSLAVAGFKEEDLSITLHNSVLTIKGEKNKEEKSKQVFLHRGLSLRDFQRTFTLAEHMNVVYAELKNGILAIELQRKIPEYAKPKVIPIGSKPIEYITEGDQPADGVLPLKTPSLKKVA